MEFKQKLKQWSPDEPDHALIVFNKQQQLYRHIWIDCIILALLLNACNSISFSPLLAKILQQVCLFL